MEGAEVKKRQVWVPLTVFCTGAHAKSARSHARRDLATLAMSAVYRDEDTSSGELFSAPNPHSRVGSFSVHYVGDSIPRCGVVTWTRKRTARRQIMSEQPGSFSLLGERPDRTLTVTCPTCRLPRAMKEDRLPHLLALMLGLGQQEVDMSKFDITRAPVASSITWHWDKLYSLNDHGNQVRDRDRFVADLVELLDAPRPAAERLWDQRHPELGNGQDDR